MFMAWLINNNLEGKFHKKESRDSLRAVRSMEMTGREFLVKECDKRLLPVDLSKKANAFARAYYESDTYYADYASVLAKELPSLYHVEDSWENYHKIAPVIMRRYLDWKKTCAGKWWQFWK